mgnify:CR=1 FL=1
MCHAEADHAEADHAEADHAEADHAEADTAEAVRDSWRGGTARVRASSWPGAAR